jgi:hypothetical protein
VNRSGILGLALLLAAGTLGSAQVQNTGWRNPSANTGGFTRGERAYFDDTLFATAREGRTHRYWGYDLAIPTGSTIHGIEVRLDFRGEDAYLAVEVSWDGGVSWTSTGYVAGPALGSWRTFVLGGNTDTWGRSWTAGELTSTAFRVRLTAEEEDSRLDWVAVRVYYQAAVTLTLGVNPQLVDLGTLTLAHYDAGYKELSPAQRLTVSSAAGWSLYVAADSATWTYVGAEPPPGKPCSHLEWRVSAFGSGVTGPQTSYLGLTTGSQRVAGGTAGAGLWLDIALRVLVDYATTVPGTYELHFTYTLTLP